MQQCLKQQKEDELWEGSNSMAQWRKKASSVVSACSMGYCITGWGFRLAAPYWGHLGYLRTFCFPCPTSWIWSSLTWMPSPAWVDTPAIFLVNFMDSLRIKQDSARNQFFKIKITVKIRVGSCKGLDLYLEWEQLWKVQLSCLQLPYVLFSNSKLYV